MIEHITEVANRLAIIVTIEEYKNKEGIPTVLFAKNDAEKFKQMLIERWGYDDNEIIYLTDSNAGQNSLLNDLPYQIGQLSPNDHFLFYYAGHGFFGSDGNKLTCWDSHQFNLTDTTISLKELILDPLQKSGCNRSLIFLDCCSSYLADRLNTRDVISNLRTREFDEFMKSIPYNAIFMSCSPGEKSSSSKKIKHGIWTYHLIKALSGEAPECITEKNYITSNSLQNYLSRAIPDFIKSEKLPYAKQTPYATLSAAAEFIIHTIQLGFEKTWKGKQSPKRASPIIKKYGLKIVAGISIVMLGYFIAHQNNSSKLFLVTGIVKKIGTNTGISGAIIKTNLSPKDSAVTTSDGTFHFQVDAKSGDPITVFVQANHFKSRAENHTVGQPIEIQLDNQ